MGKIFDGLRERAASDPVLAAPANRKTRLRPAAKTPTEEKKTVPAPKKSHPLPLITAGVLAGALWTISAWGAAVSSVGASAVMIQFGSDLWGVAQEAGKALGFASGLIAARWWMRTRRKTLST